MALGSFEAAAAKVNESLKMVGQLTDLASDLSLLGGLMLPH